VQVTRNVPPKRVQVTPGSVVNYAGRSYTSDDGAFVMGDGPVADALALSGVVVIVSHEEVDAWNGEEGEEIRQRGEAHARNDAVSADVALHVAAYLRGETTASELDKAVKEARKSAPDATGGFSKYSGAPDATEVDLTTNRQRLGHEHSYDPTKPDKMTDEQGGVDAKGEWKP